jgi:hypothetical protein
MRKFAIAVLCALAVVAACSQHTKPPAGRWIGNSDSPTIMVDAWLEILPNGSVRVSAPDFLDAGDVSDHDRAYIHQRLADELLHSWKDVEARPMDFDGHTFRKPGGVAPQMEWNPGTKEMKLVFYFGMQKSIRIAMHKVDEFSADPWLLAMSNLEQQP